MPSFSLARRLVAEGLGTAFLLAIVIGSGIMGERLSGGNVALALLGNTLATGAGLVVLIGVFGPASGAHFNPAVTLAMLMRRAITPKSAAAISLQCCQQWGFATVKSAQRWPQTLSSASRPSPSPSSRLQPWYWLKRAASGSGIQCRFIFLPLRD